VRLIDRVRPAPEAEQRYQLGELIKWMSSSQSLMSVSSSLTMRGSDYTEADPTFLGYIGAIHRRNPVVSAAVMKRAQVLSQLRFRWRPDVGGDHALFTTADLDAFNRPALMPRTQLLTLAEIHASYAGNAYFYRNSKGNIRILEPDWVTIAVGADGDFSESEAPLHREVLGYIYQYGGKSSTHDPVLLPADSVGHWAPEPDPICWWRGESWVTSVVREVATDDQATDHLAKFYENAATPQAVFSFDKDLTPAQIKEYAELIHEDTAGTANAWKSLVLGGGADVQVVGSQLAQLDYRVTQGGHESRIAMRSHVPAVILQAKEGMQGSALNAGNYTATRRLWSDLWFSSASESLCASIERILPRPMGGAAELTFDPARVQFSQEDRADEAQIHQSQAAAINSLTDAGYDATSVVEAITSGDFSKLTHSGLFSVQLQPPGTTAAPTPAPAP
jgi:hypothetical protein